MKKDRGETFSSLWQNILCVVVVMVLVILFTSWIANVSNRQNINQICRQYILQMETTGYLTNEMQTNLTNDLQAAGLYDIVFTSKTTTTQVEYGQDIYLVVEGKFPVFDYKIARIKIMGIEKEMAYWNVHVEQTSISLEEKN